MKFQHQQGNPTNFSPCECPVFSAQQKPHIYETLVAVYNDKLYFYRLAKSIKTDTIYKFIPNQNSKHFIHTILTYDDTEFSDLTSQSSNHRTKWFLH